MAKTNTSSFSKVYFIGIGGIGMSALARYFKVKGFQVGGYDLTPSPLTEQLLQEGIEIHYEDRGDSALYGHSPSDTLVIITPAVPNTHTELRAFRDGGFTVIKRAEALAHAVKGERLLAVAGTHGKTTTSTILAHLLYDSVGCNAFLGGISGNYHSNLLLANGTDLVVAEADEYDRSFLRLHPYIAIVTATSPDHLDIYGTADEYRQSFREFLGQVQPEGVLIYRKESFEKEELPEGLTAFSYASGEAADVYADNIRFEEGQLYFDWHFPEKGLHYLALRLGSPIRINVENATAAIAVSSLVGVKEVALRAALASFSGIKRRFEFVLNKPERVLIDDYAHHPEELEAAISSIRSLYPQEPVLGIFQPHLYSRTRDFFKDFARALSSLDAVILLPIYPAREEPIEGVTSEMILKELSSQPSFLVEREKLVDFIREYPGKLPRVVVTFGAGNIDRIIVPLSEALTP